MNDVPNYNWKPGVFCLIEYFLITAMFLAKISLMMHGEILDKNLNC